MDQRLCIGHYVNPSRYRHRYRNNLYSRREIIALDIDTTKQAGDTTVAKRPTKLYAYQGDLTP